MAVYSLTREINTENPVCRIKFTIYKLPRTKAEDYCSNILEFHVLCLQSELDTLVILAYVTLYYITR